MSKKKNGKNNETPKTKRVAYSYEVFAKNWTKAGSVAEVVAMTGLSKNTVSAMSTKLRKAGVPLKVMPRMTARVIDVAGLKKIIRDTTPAPKSA